MNFVCVSTSFSSVLSTISSAHLFLAYWLFHSEIDNRCGALIIFRYTLGYQVTSLNKRHILHHEAHFFFLWEMQEIKNKYNKYSSLMVCYMIKVAIRKEERGTPLVVE